MHQACTCCLLLFINQKDTYINHGAKMVQPAQCIQDQIQDGWRDRNLLSGWNGYSYQQLK